MRLESPVTKEEADEVTIHNILIILTLLIVIMVITFSTSLASTIQRCFASLSYSFIKVALRLREASRAANEVFE